MPNFFVLEDFDPSIFLNTDNILTALDHGNLRAVAHLSESMRDNLPELQKDLTIIDLARRSGDLCTLLFAIVWTQVSKGKMEPTF